MKKLLLALLVSFSLLPACAFAHGHVFIGIGGGYWGPGFYTGYHSPGIGVVVNSYPGYYHHYHYWAPPPVYYVPPPTVIVEPPPRIIYREPPPPANDCYWRDGVEYCYEN